MESAREIADIQDCEYAHVRGHCIMPDRFVVEIQEHIVAVEIERDMLKEAALEHDAYKAFFQELMCDLTVIINNKDHNDAVKDLAAVVKQYTKREKNPRSYK
jgi:hypothetical protein